MWLLNVEPGGAFGLTDNLKGDSIPPYAILSHTWGENNEEVTYQDLEGKLGTDKAGYDKIRFCAKQAKCDGLDHFWVDTCCIDKKNPAELSESIASMFRWYSQARKCYVYLSDVSIAGHGQDDPPPPQSVWESAFRKSR
jgi:hypothetical protein